jgi:prepilin-type N-terminal cleavage/methylation domain-containing protein
MRAKQGEGGVTLIEIAVVLAIVGIMSLFLAPAIGTWVGNFRIKQAAREMSSDLQFAKMKAISGNFRRYCTISFNITVSGTQYDYIVYPDYDNDLELDSVDIDVDGDGTPENETNDIFKRVILNDSYRYVAFDTSQGGGDGISFLDNDDNQPSVAFDLSGLPRDNSGRLSNAGSIFIQNTKNNKRRQVTISLAGRIGTNEY